MLAQQNAALPEAAPTAGDLKPIERLLTVKEVGILTTLSRDRIYKLMKAGQFPRPLSLSGQRVAWRVSTIAAWMNGLPEGGFAGKRSAG